MNHVFWSPLSSHSPSTFLASFLINYNQQKKRLAGKETKNYNNTKVAKHSARRNLKEPRYFIISYQDFYGEVNIRFGYLTDNSS